MYRKLLIANRGEIACRIARTARRLGIETVAVYSDADAHAMHVAMADEAWPIGGSPSSESYLSIDKLIAVARSSGAQAVHPGYGFLAENAAFAEGCAQAGLDFVGPPPQAMRLLGSKVRAKSLMAREGVPVVPGYHDETSDRARLRKAALQISFPLLIKASAGGGGRGMRIVEAPEVFDDAVISAEREALASFGDPQLLLEKYLARPRHIEIQIFADSHGAVIAFAERDCSIQRHHQKVIEETPAIGLSPALSFALRDTAIRAVRHVGYVGAGTVEFLIDGDAFFFLEVNTRIQVEHPVTEMISGVDLVEWQLRIACGEKLPLTQDEIEMRGCAIEARVCAEDPGRDFIPAVGVIEHYRPPEGEGVRVDAGFQQGDRITEHYDSLIAKLVVHDSERSAAVERLSRALDEFELSGVTTNLDFLRAIARHPSYVAGACDTGFVSRELASLTERTATSTDVLLLASASAQFYYDLRSAQRQCLARGDPFSPWIRADGWRLYHRGSVDATFNYDGRMLASQLFPLSENSFRLVVSGSSLQIEFALSGQRLSLRIDGVERKLVVVRREVRFTVILGGRNHLLELIEAGKTPSGPSADDTLLSAPIPARVTRIFSHAGDLVDKGAALVVLEAMKMEFTLCAPRKGVVAAVRCAEGDQVQEGVQLVILEDELA